MAQGAVMTSAPTMETLAQEYLTLRRQQPVVPDADEVSGEHVEQEPAEEGLGGKGQGLGCLVLDPRSMVVWRTIVGGKRRDDQPNPSELLT